MDIFFHLFQNLIPLYVLIALGWISGRYFDVDRQSLGALGIFIIQPIVSFGFVAKLEFHPSFIAIPVIVYVLFCGLLWGTYYLSKKINLTPSLYLKAGAIHGCVLCVKNKPLIYMEDVGRHNAIDKIAGYMKVKKISPANKIFYTTGRLTSEMVMKSVQMRIPIVISRSGFTAWGVDLARQANLTLIGRAKGKKFFVLSGEHRIE